MKRSDTYEESAEEREESCFAGEKGRCSFFLEKDDSAIMIQPCS
jgi:hypothetical protein